MSAPQPRANGSEVRPARPWYAVAGLLATLAGVAAGHLLAGLLAPSASPVLAIGSTVIDLTPTPVKEWAVSHFGTADKTILLSGVSVATAVLALLVGLFARGARRLGTGMLAVLAGLPVVAAATRPTTTLISVLPSLVTVGVGLILATLLWLLLDRQVPQARSQQTSEPPEPDTPSAQSPGRRVVLGAFAGALAFAAAAGAGGMALAGRTRQAIGRLPLPRARIAALPTGVEQQVPGISSFRTSNRSFYRVDTALVVPQIDVESWRLRIDGDVDRPRELTYSELLDLPMIERDITMTCVSNEVGGSYVSSARWLGVPTRELLAAVGLRGGVEQILSHSEDGMTISTPVQALTDDRDALVAIAMNGEPLPAEHGFPARLLTPGLYGFVGATKWLVRMQATSYADQAYWTKRGWATDAPILTQSRIDTPRGLSTIAAGQVLIGGVAWAQRRGITGVQVRVDDGPWQDAMLGPQAGIDYWRQWYLPWQATPGRHNLTVRATDGNRAQQTAKTATPFPRGASGYHQVVVFVE